MLFGNIYKKILLKKVFLYVCCLINKNMVNEHYEKYKDTIKKCARRHYRKRIVLLNEYLADKSCKHCGESETVCLKFYPHDSEIRKKTKRVGTSNESRKEIFELMDDSYILCSNCWIKLDNDLIEFI